MTAVPGIHMAKFIYAANERQIVKLPVLEETDSYFILKGQRKERVDKSKDGWHASVYGYVCSTHEEAIQKHLHCVKEKEKIIDQGIRAWEQDRESLHQISEAVLKQGKL